MMFRPYFGALVVLVFACLAAPAAAEEIRQHPKAVLELFTSQGCSSCPPADALLAKLAGRDDVIALAYHVDYWDYIGWADTFGDAHHSERQRSYARSWGGNRIYTPQLIVNGQKDVVGSREVDVSAAIDRATLSVAVNLRLDGDTLLIDAEARPDLPKSVVWLVSFLDRAEVEIPSGENSGKRIEYRQVVTGRQMVGMWEPASGAHLKLPIGELLSGRSNGAVILIQGEQQGLPGPVLGAALLQR